MKLLTLVMIAALAGCSLFGPPLPPSSPTPQQAEYAAQPALARDSLIACTRQYGSTNARADGVAVESIVDAALYSCTAQLEAYRTIAADRARGEARVLGFIDRGNSYTEEAVEDATKEARSAALDAIVRARSAR